MYKVTTLVGLFQYLLTLKTKNAGRKLPAFLYII